MKFLHSKTPLILVFLMACLRAEAVTVADNPTVSLLTGGPLANQMRYTLSNFRVLNSSVTGNGTLYEADDVEVTFSSGRVDNGPGFSYDYAQVRFYEASGQGFSGGTGHSTAFTIAYDVAVENAASGDPAKPNRMSYTPSDILGSPFGAVILTLTASDGFNTAALKAYPGADISGFVSRFTVTNTVSITGGAPPFNGIASIEGLYNTFIVPEAHSAFLVLLSLGALGCRRQR